MLEYGCVPSSLVAALKTVDRNADYRVRNAAVEEIARRVIDAASAGSSSVVVPHLAPLLRFLSVLLHDTNARVVAVTMDMLTVLAERCAVDLRPHLQLILSRLIEKYGDKVGAIRSGALTVLQQLIATTPWDLLVYHLLCCLKYPSATVREHAVIALCYLLLGQEPRQPPR